MPELYTDIHAYVVYYAVHKHRRRMHKAMSCARLGCVCVHHLHLLAGH
nr:MAG TPA: hypothetical protein [Caudoviricetes sp.]